MTGLVVALVVLLALVLLLVAGLLRSHAEILRRLHELEAGDRGEAIAGEERAPLRVAGALAPPINGSSLTGDAVRVGFAPGADTLVAFLTSGCSVCQDLWASLPNATRGGLADLRVAVVAKDRKFESLSKLRRLAPDGVTVVLSSAAWDDYDVPASPYFVHVGTNGEIAGEGVSSTWDGVRSLLIDARDELNGQSEAGSARMRRAEEELVGAGVGPEHPSLYGGAAQGG